MAIRHFPFAQHCKDSRCRRNVSFSESYTWSDQVPSAPKRRGLRGLHVYSSDSARWDIQGSGDAAQRTYPDPDVAADIHAIIEGFRLQRIRRFFHQRSWEEESTQAEFSDRAEPGLKLENVAAHSWHVADLALLLADRFEQLDPNRCLALAVLHDKLEIFTGDFNPVGRDGLGTKTHAFSSSAARRKIDLERKAASAYLSRLRLSIRSKQESLLNEIMDGSSQEARFIKAIDKLQGLAFVFVKKNGRMTDHNIQFVLRYTGKIPHYFPPLFDHHKLLTEMLLDAVARDRGWTRERLDGELFGQLELELL